MDIRIIAAAAISLLLLGSFFVFRKKTPSAKSKTTQTPVKKTFHGVSIAPCVNSCDQAIKYQQKRFLPNEVPILPLPECNKHCTCTYMHHDDRRMGSDRRALSIKMGEQNADNRDIKGRRKTDQLNKMI